VAVYLGTFPESIFVYYFIEHLRPPHARGKICWQLLHHSTNNIINGFISSYINLMIRVQGATIA
jgi:hypothetical protein